ncbi:MAG: heavy metal translocating P-type ATPase metal-binding domain-containing protein [Thermoflexibacter sp.]|nr:heavy metal translocating P-type ATPase metal-binding domain-containing protein [Thermoflexibacter sp.]
MPEIKSIVKESLAEQHLSCYHCGEECEHEPSLSVEDKQFCCQGCKTVYEILNDNNLCNYYNLADKTTGKSLKDLPMSNQFAFLEEKATASKLLDFSDGSLSKMTFYIPSIHCSACIWLLENMHKLDENILNSRVNFLRREVSVTFRHDEISLRQVADLLASVGYTPLIRLDSLEKKESNKQKEIQQDKKAYRQMYYKLGVAFFCFGNIMLLSLPEYLSFSDYIESNFRKLFGYLNFILALPVAFYSGTYYFQSAFNAFRQRHLNIEVPIALGIVVLFLVSSYEVFTETGAGYFDSLGGLIFFLLLGRLFQQKTYQSLSFERDHLSYFPVSVLVKQPNDRQEITQREAYHKPTFTEKYVPVKELNVGDRIVIHHQELVPADAILLHVNNASGKALIDYSFVTGEAIPVEKVSGEMIYAGGRQIGGTIELEVMKPFSQSYLTQLWNNDVFKKQNESKITRITDQFSKRFTINLLAVATLATSYWLWQGDSSTALKVFTSVLIVACPCALALSAPFALGNALRILGKHKLYLKSTDAVEHLAQIDTIVFDKTGTITDNHKTQVKYEGKSLTYQEVLMMQTLAKNSTHPLSKALAKVDVLSICEKSKDEAIQLDGKLTNFKEHIGRGIEGEINGTHLILGSFKFISQNLKGFSEPSRADNASVVHLAIGGEYKGRFLINNEYRKGLATMLNHLEDRYELLVLSGDNEQEKERLGQLFERKNLTFKQTPQDKLNFIKNLQMQGKNVMMIGDGLNDAGALKQSNVGLALAEDIASFSPASDGILDASAFTQLPQFLKIAHASKKIVHWSFAISLAYNIVGLSFAVQGLFSPVISAILMPLSSISVVGFATLAVGIWVKNILKHK